MNQRGDHHNPLDDGGQKPYMASSGESYYDNDNYDVSILQIVLLIIFGLYLLSLSTMGKWSITHTWLFTKLTVVQPTMESIRILQLQQQHEHHHVSDDPTTNNNNHHERRHHHPTTTPNNIHHNHHQSTSRQRRSHQNRSNQQQQQRSNHHLNDPYYHHRIAETTSTSTTTTTTTLEEQLSILEFTKGTIPAGMIAFQQYKRRNRISSSTNTTSNDATTIAPPAASSTTTSTNTTTTNHNNNNNNDAFTMWKYLETTVLLCIACFVLLVIRWFTHLRCCYTYVNKILPLLLLVVVEEKDDENNNRTQQSNQQQQFQQYQHQQRMNMQEQLENEWIYNLESNYARWWLMLFILLTILTWFYLALMASKVHWNGSSSSTTSVQQNHYGRQRQPIVPILRNLIQYPFVSYLTAMVVGYCVWSYIGARNPIHSEENNKGGNDDDSYHPMNHGVQHPETSITTATSTITRDVHTIDGALDELSSRIVLLARLLGWKMDSVTTSSLTDDDTKAGVTTTTTTTETLLVWHILRRSIRIMVTLCCTIFSFVVAVPIYTYQYAMIYRLYVGSSNDIQYNQKGIRSSSGGVISRWYNNTQSKRIYFMECIWECIIFMILLVPMINLYYIYDFHTIDYGGFVMYGSVRVISNMMYVLMSCILVRQFQQDYLYSALPTVVIQLEQEQQKRKQQLSLSSQQTRFNNEGVGIINNNHNIHNNSNQSSTTTQSSTAETDIASLSVLERFYHEQRILQQQQQQQQDATNHNNNNHNNNNVPIEEEDHHVDNDLYQVITNPFHHRIDTILQHGTKLVCIPLLFTILFSIHHISDFQRGYTTFPTAYGGPFIQTTTTNMNHYHYNTTSTNNNNNNNNVIQKWKKERALAQISSFLPKELLSNYTEFILSTGITTTTPTTQLEQENDDGTNVNRDESCSATTTTTSTTVISNDHNRLNQIMHRTINYVRSYLFHPQSNLSSNQTCLNDNLTNHNETKTMVPDNNNTAMFEKPFSLLDECSKPLPVTLVSALHKVQKLAKLSLHDNYTRACLTGYYDTMKLLVVNNQTTTTNQKSNNHHSTTTNHQQRNYLHPTIDLVTLEKTKLNVDTTFQELQLVLDAILHHPVITAEIVYTLTRFIEFLLCILWTVTILPRIVWSHTSMRYLRVSILKLNTSALHANPQDAAY